MNVVEFIKECQEKVFAGTHISSDDAKKLLNIPDNNLKNSPIYVRVRGSGGGRPKR